MRIPFINLSIIKTSTVEDIETDIDDIVEHIDNIDFKLTKAFERITALENDNYDRGRINDLELTIKVFAEHFGLRFEFIDEVEIDKKFMQPTIKRRVLKVSNTDMEDVTKEEHE